MDSTAHTSPHLRVLSVALSTVMLCMVSGCANSMFYYPDSLDHTRGLGPGLPHEDVYFNSKDGTRLHGWFMTSQVQPPKATVVHFHGNAQNLSSHFLYSSWMPELGYNVLIFDYRGYGKSEGEINRKGAFQDCEAALRYVKSREDVDPEKLLLFGQSLGGAHALAVMKSPDSEGVKGIVSESAFYCYRDVGRHAASQVPVLGWFSYPLSFIMFSNTHSPKHSLKHIDDEIILYIHPQQDTVVPIEEFNKLYSETRDNAKFWVPKRIDHLAPYSYLPVKYIRNVSSFFDMALE